MTGPVVRAEADSILWLIIGIFWVVVQLANAAAQKKRPPPRPAEDGEGTGAPPSDPLAEMLRKLTGAQETTLEPQEEPEPQVVWESAGAYTQKQPWLPGGIEALPEPAFLTVAPVAAAEPPAAPEIPEIDIRPKMSAFRSSVPSIRMPSLRMQPMDLHFQCATHHDRDQNGGRSTVGAEQLNLTDRRTLRRAMLSHLIFSPPKGLEQQR